MAKKLIELENGLLMEVEIPEDSDGIEPISGGNGEIVKKINESMGTVEKMLIKSVEPVVNAYNALNKDIVLEKAEVEVGIGFSAEGEYICG